jgi:uncharacterized protein YjdB
MVLAADSTESTNGTESTSNTDNSETIDNMESSDETETSETTESAWEYETPISNDSMISGGSAVSVGNKIYYTGGTKRIGSDYVITNEVRIYDTNTKRWSFGTPFKTARGGHVSAVYNNKIYIMGGQAKNGITTTVEIYDINTDTWSQEKSMLYFESLMDCILVGDKIYVLNPDNTHNSNVQIYDIENDTWSYGVNLPEYLYQPRAAAIGDKIYVVARTSQNDGKQKPIYIYDTTTDSWSTTGTLLNSVHYTNCVAVGNKIYVTPYEDYKTVGGSNKTIIYDVTTNTWTQGPNLNEPRLNRDITLAGNKIYVIGGNNSNSKTTVESLVVDAPNDGTNDNKLSVLLNQGESVKLSVTSTPSDNSKYTWTSSDETVATVDENGVVTAVNTGKANIYAENTDDNFKEYIPVVVVEGTADETRLAVSLGLNQTKKLYLNDDYKNITWSSNDDSKVTVSDSGEITGIAKGLALINASYNDETYNIYVRVTNS